MFIPHQDPIRYVGSPTKEIDEAWKDLINREFFLHRLKRLANDTDFQQDILEFRKLRQKKHMVETINNTGIRNMDLILLGKATSFIYNGRKSLTELN